MNRFCFIDSSGIIKNDKFFGAGLLVVKNVGDMVDKLAKNAQPAYVAAKQAKDKVIDGLILRGEHDQVIKILRNRAHFEMKFDNVRKTTEIYYQRMIDIFLSDKDNRFSAVVVNKENPTFNGALIEDTWETYTKYSAQLVIQEMRNMSSDKFCIVVDEITKPRNKPLSLEDTLLSKIRTGVNNDQSIQFDNVFGAISIESHSNMLMQLCDVLLGSVMYDYKKKAYMTSDKIEARKENLVKKIRNVLKTETLAKEIVDKSLVHFSVNESA